MHVETTEDHVQYHGSADAIVTQMRESAPLPVAENHAYRQDVASRVHLWKGVHIASSTSEDFLRDLLRHDLLRQVEIE